MVEVTRLISAEIMFQFEAEAIVSRADAARSVHRLKIGDLGSQLVVDAVR
jgi:hypothetical protein